MLRMTYRMEVAMVFWEKDTAAKRRENTDEIRQALRLCGVTHNGKPPCVRTRKNSAGEYMAYEIHVDTLTDEQWAGLRAWGFYEERARCTGLDIVYCDNVARSPGWRRKMAEGSTHD